MEPVLGPDGVPIGSPRIGTMRRVFGRGSYGPMEQPDDVPTHHQIHDSDGSWRLGANRRTIVRVLGVRAPQGSFQAGSRATGIEVIAMSKSVQTRVGALERKHGLDEEDRLVVIETHIIEPFLNARGVPCGEGRHVGTIHEVADQPPGPIEPTDLVPRLHNVLVPTVPGTPSLSESPATDWLLVVRFRPQGIGRVSS